MDVSQSFNKKGKSTVNPTETFAKKNINDKRNNHCHLYNHKNIRDTVEEMFEGNQDVSPFDDVAYTYSDSIHGTRKKRIKPEHYKFNPTPGAKAQIHLAKILSKHNCDFGLFDRITSWAKFYGNKPNFIWDGIDWMSRKTLISYLEQNLKMKHLQPIEVDVFLDLSNTTISVPTFNYTSMVMSMLHDENLMQRKNIIPDFNIIKGTSTTESTKYSDIHTGSLYGKAMSRYIEGPNDMPLPLYVFIDETHPDLHGALKMAPVMITFAFFHKRRVIHQSFGDHWVSFLILTLESLNQAPTYPSRN